jgi:hypothetical protein
MIKGIHNPGSPYVWIGHFVEAIRQDASGFSSCSWVHCCTEANVVAHVLARETSSKCFSNCWFEDMLLFILMFLVETFWSLDCNLVIFLLKGK